MRLGVVGVFLFCFLGLAGDARAADPLWPDAGDVYQYLRWEFSVPVKFKNMMNECKKAWIKVKVLDANGGVLAEAGDMIDLLGEASGPNFETVRVLTLNPAPGKDPFSAKRYTVDLTFDDQQTPGFNQQKIQYRAKDGTDLVYHIDEPMPEMPAADMGNAGAGANAIQ
jgi:hypothetical protein